MLKYLTIIILSFVPFFSYTQLNYVKSDLETYRYYTYFYDLNGDSKKEAIEFADEINIFYQTENSFSHSPITIPYPVKNFVFNFALLEKGQGYDLIFFREDGIYRFKKIKGLVADDTEKLIDTASIYVESDNRSKRFASISFDLNGDGIDEIFVPRLEGPLLFQEDVKGFRNIDFPAIPLDFSQKYLGMNFKSIEEEGNFDSLSYSYMSEYSLPQLLIRDFNNDGLKDIGIVYTRALDSTENYTPDDLQTTESELALESKPYARRSAIDIYLQKENLKFSPNADYKFVTPTASYIYGVLFFLSDSQIFWDLNDDNFPDLIVKHTEDNVFNPKTTYKIYIGDKKEGFKKNFDQALVTKDFLGQNFLSDINGDGLVDISMMYVDVNFSSAETMAKIILGREVDIEIRGYLGKKGKLFGEKADITKRLEISSHCFNWYYLPNFQLNYDFDGDGKLDLAIREAVDKVCVYNFISEEKGFSNKPVVTFKVSEDSEIVFDYLNNDKKVDVIKKESGKKLNVYLSK